MRANESYFAAKAAESKARELVKRLEGEKDEILEKRLELKHVIEKLKENAQSSSNPSEIDENIKSKVEESAKLQNPIDAKNGELNAASADLQNAITSLELAERVNYVTNYFDSFPGQRGNRFVSRRVISLKNCSRYLN